MFSLLPSGPADAQCASRAKFALLQIYSNADGSVQFLELSPVVTDGNVPSLAGAALIAGNGTMENAYTFPDALPGGKTTVGDITILVGTQGFADLDLVKPDFVIPNGFIFLRNGSIRFADTPWCAGPVSYDALPADGVNAYFPDAFGDSGVSRGPAKAFNTAGQFYDFTSYGGLWWKAPAGSESGWGIVIERQRDTVFAAWATYDTDGSPVWFVIPNASPAPFDASTYRGAIYRTTGPALIARSFDPSAVGVTPVGSGSVHFDNAQNATFTYMIGRDFAEVNITPELFAQHSIPDMLAHTDRWLDEQGRITNPMLRRRGADRYEPVSWEEAFVIIGRALAGLASPDEAAFYTSGRASNEAAFLYQLLVRSYGTNNLPDCSNMCHESSGLGLTESLGAGKATVSLDGKPGTEGRAKTYADAPPNVGALL